MEVEENCGNRMKCAGWNQEKVINKGWEVVKEESWKEAENSQSVYSGRIQMFF